MAHLDPYDCEEYEVFHDGEHEVNCHECDKDFEVSTYVSYYFKSPEAHDANDDSEENAEIGEQVEPACQEGDSQVQETES